MFRGALSVRKLSGSGGGVASLEDKDAPAWASNHDVCVLGSTVWQVDKVPPDNLAFDLIVVDEGSQVKVGEAAIPLLGIADAGVS